MTIILDEELSVRLAQEAKRRGEKAEEVAAQLLRQSLNDTPAGHTNRSSVMEYAGIGAGRPGALRGRDAQEYVDELRGEWEDRERQWDR
jgi:hypothetical protein